MPDTATREVLTITVADSSYRITNPGGRVGSKLVNGEPYEKRLLADIWGRHLVGTAFDIGAHVGNHSLYLAAVCGLRVHAWEPHDRSRRMLEGNLALNPDLDVTVHAWAAGSRETRGRFTPGRWVEFDPQREGATLTIDRGHIPVRRIDDHLYVDDLVVVKVDVEGMESDVLGGMTRHLTGCKPIVYAETHTRTAGQRTAAVLEPLGYEPTATIAMGSVMQVWEAR